MESNMTKDEIISDLKKQRDEYKRKYSEVNVHEYDSMIEFSNVISDLQAKNKDLEGQIETFKKEVRRLVSSETSLNDLARSLSFLCED